MNKNYFFSNIRFLCQALVLLAISSFSFSQVAPSPNYVGSDACAQCHQEQTENWQASHHWHAMEEATVESVLGDFDNAQFDYFGTVSTFYKKEDQYYVKTDNSEGELEDFVITYTFGFFPLQQYLIEFPDGRLQALSVSWDSRSAAEGGQKWYHLYPDEEVSATDPLHWTGSFQNWNSRCASCHSTNLEKNYSALSNRYTTSFEEMNVSCESCHGPASEHVDWAQGDLNLSDGMSLVSQNEEVCATCHSRRAEISHRDISQSFYNDNSLSILSEGLYYSDGQILDEVYVYGSFLQSKMHQNQVTCSNCHEPHSQDLLVEGNGLCLQCHDEELNQEQHFFHEPDSSGAQCINCHMPVSTYMGVDERRDHSFRIPDPIASVSTGVPNACSACHLDKTLEWVAENFTRLTGRTEVHYQHGAIIDRARSNDSFVNNALLNLAGDESVSPIIRATAIAEAGRFPSQASLSAILDALQSSESLIRENAVKSLSFLPVENRFQALQPLINDPIKSVRIQVAKMLAGFPVEQLPPALAVSVSELFEEFVQAALFNADLPGAMTDLGAFYAANNETVKAEQAYVQAKRLAPSFLPVLLNLADLYRELEREAEGESLLKDAIQFFPESANAHHALGLLYIRTQRVEESLPSLQLAEALDQDNARFALVYSVALESIGELLEAIAVLEKAVERFPTNDQLYQVLNDYNQRR